MASSPTRESEAVTTVSGRVAAARMEHVDRIHELVTYYAERNRMLFRPLEELYEDIRDFRVYLTEGARVLGCCALELYWRDLGEIKSLAVDPHYQHCGIGVALVRDALADAVRLGLTKVFALTYEVQFFEKLGFHTVAKETLPHKVWTDCIRCPLRDDCREVPMLIELPQGGKNQHQE